MRNGGRITVRLGGLLGVRRWGNLRKDSSENLIHWTQLVGEDLFINLARRGCECIPIRELPRESKCHCPVVDDLAQKLGWIVISSGSNFMEKLIVGKPKVCSYGSLSLLLAVSVGWL